MADELLSQYLPTREQLAGRLPEREFFFGIVGTMRNQYLKDVIKDAHKKRYTIADDDPKKEGILISDQWLAELQKHPYHSSKLKLLTFIEKPGTGIFLMKERAKLYRPQTDRKVHTLSKRLSSGSSITGAIDSTSGTSQKRMNLGGG